MLLTLGTVAGFVLGVMVARPHPAPSPSAQEISQAQHIGNRLLPPMWLGVFRDRAWLNSLRRCGYVYCYRNKSIKPDCAREQDEAVQNVFFALTVSKAQQKMWIGVGYHLGNPRSHEIHSCEPQSFATALAYVQITAIKTPES